MGTIELDLAEARYRVTFVPTAEFAARHHVAPELSGPALAKKFAAAGFTSVRVVAGWTPLDTDWCHVERAIAVDVTFPPVVRVTQRDHQWKGLWALLDGLTLAVGMISVVPVASPDAPIRLAPGDVLGCEVVPSGPDEDWIL